MRRTFLILVAIPVGLLVLGIAVIASTGGVAGLRYHDAANYFSLRQVVYGVLAVLLAFFIANMDYRIWYRREVMIGLLLLTLLGLGSVFIPGLGIRVKGSYRWVNLGLLRIQPSEFVKIFLIVLLAGWFGRVSRRQERFLEGCVPPVLILGVVVFGFLKQPDLGSTVLAFAITGIIMFVAGVRILYLGGVGLGGIATMGAVLLLDPERRRRVNIAFNPDNVSSADAHQIVQSLSAFQRGGVRGVGYGKSLLKERYLPESHTDFILSMAGEELGLICTLLVVAAYAAILFAGITTALRATDKFGRLLAFGMTFHICFSAAANIAVVTRLAPTKGLALPFMSYGGSNLIASMAGVGFILSVARQAGEKRRIPTSEGFFSPEFSNP